MNNEKRNSLEIELSDEIAQGTYSNMVFLAHSHSEFILDFISLLPGVPKAKVKSRIVMVPEHAKRLLLALSENISKYELNYGEIKLEEPKGSLELPMDGNIGQA